MKLIEQNFQKQSVISEIEKCGMKYANKIDIITDLEYSFDEIVQFYIDPAKFLEHKFNEIWNLKAGKIIDACQKNYFYTITDLTSNTIEYFEFLLRKIKQNKADKLSTMLFISEKDLSDNELKQNCSKAACMYICLLLREEITTSNSEVTDIEIKLDDQSIMYARKNPRLPLAGDVAIASIDEKSKKILSLLF